MGRTGRDEGSGKAGWSFPSFMAGRCFSPEGHIATSPQPGSPPRSLLLEGDRAQKPLAGRMVRASCLHMQSLPVSRDQTGKFLKEAPGSPRPSSLRWFSEAAFGNTWERPVGHSVGGSSCVSSLGLSYKPSPPGLCLLPTLYEGPHASCSGHIMGLQISSRDNVPDSWASGPSETLFSPLETRSTTS